VAERLSARADEHRAGARRRPAALVPAVRARLAGFIALAALGALEWQRMVAGYASARALLWVLVAAVGAWLLVRAARGRTGQARWSRRPRRTGQARSSRDAPSGLLCAGVAAATLVAAVLFSGLELVLLEPARWTELFDGLVRGAETVGAVRLPYEGPDPWPVRILELWGALLCAVAALLAVWPRTPRTSSAATGTQRDTQRTSSVGTGGLGYPFLSLAVLLVLVASPVVAVGGARPALLGLVLTALTVAFLWLERLPLRPGLGIAALGAIVVAGALPLASAADGEDPWFDYKGFAEGFGVGPPVSFTWDHAYGPLDWPRDGGELLRVATRAPSYWKVRDLEEFDEDAWQTREEGYDRRSAVEDDLPFGWNRRRGWTRRLPVTVRRLRSRELVGAGTALTVQDESWRPAGSPPEPVSAVSRALRRGDAYTVRAYVPRPSPAQLARARASGGQDDARELELETRSVPQREGRPFVASTGAEVRFPAFDEPASMRPQAWYPATGLPGPGEAALEGSDYRRAWELSRELRRESATPLEYVQAVDRHLRTGFAYSERPPAPRLGQAPLDAFLFDGKEGYCQHFSGAMALLLRMGGLPVRVAVGFSPGGYSKRREAWIVRDTDAHSWVEVWFDDFGWVPFDPTPPATPARSQIASLVPVAPPSAGDDAAGGTAGDDRPPRPAPSGGADGAAGADDAADGSGGGEGPAWWWLFGLPLLLVPVAAWWWARRRGRPAGTIVPDRAVAELERALRRSGRPAPGGTTLAQLERRLGATPEAAGYLRALRGGRYAPAAAAPTGAGRRALRRELGRGAGPAGRLRALWALPPWRALR